MTTSTKKQIALELLAAAESGDAATSDRLTTDDFHFQFMQRLESWDGEDGKSTTRINKADFINNGIKMVGDLTKAGMNFRVDLAIEEGDHVAIFGESNGEIIQQPLLLALHLHRGQGLRVPRILRYFARASAAVFLKLGGRAGERVMHSTISVT